jgi:hypothetical protein
MICAMLNVDFKQQSILFIVIEKENLDRMKKADPITLESVKSGGVLGQPKYPKDFSMLIAYEEECAEIYNLAKRGDAFEILRFLERGRVFDPATDGAKNVIKLDTREPN